MMPGFLWGLLSLALLALATHLFMIRKKDAAFVPFVFALLTLAWSVWMSHHATLGCPRTKFDLREGECYTRIDYCAFEQHVYEIIVEKDGEVRLYRFMELTPEHFRVMRDGDGHRVFEDLDRAPR